jgi:hypothetical protein
VCALTKHVSDETKEHEMGSRNTHTRYEKCVTDLLRKPEWKTPLGNLGVYVRIILK